MDTNDTFFFFRVTGGKPEVFPVVTQTRRMVLDGVSYLLIELPAPKAKAAAEPAPLAHKEREPKAKKWPLDRVRELIRDADPIGGISPLALRQHLADLGKIPIGPLLVALMRAGEAKRLSTGNWSSTS